ncbi:MAG: hypothetical protein ABEJ02_02590 [Candidatus Paceibacteria bacterium]
MDLSEEYPEVWQAIEHKKVSKKEIDEFLLSFVLELCKDIKKGKRDDEDIGDAPSIGIQHAETNGYSLSSKVEEFLLELYGYKAEPFGEEVSSPTIEEIEKRAKNLLEELQKNSK